MVVIELIKSKMSLLEREFLVGAPGLEPGTR
jgi:hypothetical protein